MRKQVWILAAMLLMLFPARVFAQETTSSVTVQGRGCVTVTPDLGTISFAVTQEDEEAEQVEEVLTTLRPEEVPAWNRSLILRGISVPDQIKDELLMLLEG